MAILPLTLLLGAAASSVLAAGSSRPRGVGPEFAKFYTPADTFTCISNPSIKIAASKINDDYCDCPDGSDEPGTSACSYLSPLTPSWPAAVVGDTSNTTLALPGFYCKNKGHIPAYVPFERVNDGACDYELCCDGSEEWQGVGGVTCENRCKEIGKEWRSQDEQRKRSLGTAIKKRKELVAEAGRLRKEVEDRIEDLKIQIQGNEMKVQNLERDLADLERRERGRVVKPLGTGSKVNVLAGQAKARIEELREAAIKVRQERDEYEGKLKELETILSTFKVEYNPNFNDEGVKRAVRSWEDYAAQQPAGDGNTALERDLDEILKPDSETGTIDWEEYGSVQEDDVEALYKFEEYLPTSVRDWIHEKWHDLRVLLIQNGILAESTPGVESKGVSTAKNSLNAAINERNSAQADLQRHQDDLSKDYGEDDIFRALKGQCVSTDSGEYTYSLCWLDRTVQKPKKGGGDTGMGNFVRLDKVTVDEEVLPDGKGLGSGERVALRFENGQHCWNGPNRSTLVILACAEKDEIWKIVEEEKCVYRMEVGTPAVCSAHSSSAGAARSETPKDEL
ncbi:hypothetical protein L228DRAFT_282931 [Xylona heveae TC161]|uniref:Glucosidase 2 subunit beta n=1 Tax=Xylona heveae (strain CBS 132557 / TC161) TaxID=1328760 RepID=A0A165H107_XYLHT|nr:hypothetical protein L228DRAFT_282931 [Xylona heveae TC161]KZF22852.1 hypothetical protein L228DRAFT_282931 [Xylona heveae TC161]